ncbi:unnamed protein product, partial [Gordionus sp. m RMFG-2023]
MTTSHSLIKDDINDKIEEYILLKMIDTLSLGICLEMHRSIKFKLFREKDLDTKDNSKFNKYTNHTNLHLNSNIPSLVCKPKIKSNSILSDNYFYNRTRTFTNSQYDMIKNYQCVCINCNRNIAASRFAPHLEKCLGMGRNSSRLATKKIKRSIYIENTNSNDESYDDAILNNDNLSEYINEFDNPNSNVTDGSSTSSISNSSNKINSFKKSLKKKKKYKKEKLEDKSYFVQDVTNHSPLENLLQNANKVDYKKCLNLRFQNSYNHIQNPSLDNLNLPSSIYSPSNIYLISQSNLMQQNIYKNIKADSQNPDKKFLLKSNEYDIKDISEMEVGDIVVLKLSYLIEKKLISLPLNKYFLKNSNISTNLEFQNSNPLFQRWIGEVIKFCKSSESQPLVDLRWLDIILENKIDNYNLFKNFAEKQCQYYRLIKNKKLLNQTYPIESSNQLTLTIDANAIAMLFKFDLTQTLSENSLK